MHPVITKYRAGQITAKKAAAYFDGQVKARKISRRSAAAYKANLDDVRSGTRTKSTPASVDSLPFRLTTRMVTYYPREVDEPEELKQDPDAFEFLVELAFETMPGDEDNDAGMVWSGFKLILNRGNIERAILFTASRPRRDINASGANVSRSYPTTFKTTAQGGLIVEPSAAIKGRGIPRVRFEIDPGAVRAIRKLSKSEIDPDSYTDPARLSIYCGTVRALTGATEIKPQRG